MTTPAARIAALREKVEDKQDTRLRRHVVPAVLDHLEGVFERHAAEPEQVELMLHYDGPECQECEDGGGHLSTVCSGCFPVWDGMDGHALWPCPDATAALALLAKLDGGTP